MSLLPDQTFAAPGVPFFGAGGSGPVGPNLTLTGNLSVGGTSTLTGDVTAAGELDVGINLFINKGSNRGLEIVTQSSNNGAFLGLKAAGTDTTILQLLPGGAVAINGDSETAPGSLTVASLLGTFGKIYSGATLPADYVSEAYSLNLGGILVQTGNISYPAGSTNLVVTWPTPFKTVSGVIPNVVLFGGGSAVATLPRAFSTSEIGITVVATLADGSPTTTATNIQFIAMGEAP